MKQPDLSLNIYVANIAYEVTQADLHSFFEDRFGKVERTDIIHNRETNKSMGFGFVLFVDPQSAVAAKAEPLELLGRRLRVETARPRRIR